MKTTVLVAAALLMVGCVNPEKRTAALRAESLRLGACVMHQVPLKKGACYSNDFKGCILYVDYVYRDYQRFPNPLPIDASPVKTELHTKSTTVLYCPVCEKKVNSLLERHSG
jgi:hypothetical protein